MELRFFIRSDIPFVQLQLHSPLQAVALKFFINRSITICSLYLPPTDAIDKNELGNFLTNVQYLSSYYEILIVAIFCGMIELLTVVVP